MIPTPIEVLQMGKIQYNPETNDPIFPKEATEEQIMAYYKWREQIKSSCKQVKIEQ